MIRVSKVTPLKKETVVLFLLVFDQQKQNNK